MNSKKVSIALATYNGERFLHQQLNSLLAQSRLPEEIIICDDGSTDSTKSILNEYKKKHPEIIAVYENKTNLGYIKNFERCISLCTGDYIALCDQDDIWEPQKLEILQNTIGESVLIHSDASLIDSDGEIIEISFTAVGKKDIKVDFTTLFFKPSITGCTLMFDRKILADIPAFPALIPHDYFISLLASEKGIAYVPIPLVKYRQHDKNILGYQRHKTKKGLLFYARYFFLYKQIQRRIFEKHAVKFNLLRETIANTADDRLKNTFNNIGTFLNSYTHKKPIDTDFSRQYNKYFKYFPNKNCIDYFMFPFSWMY